MNAIEIVRKLSKKIGCEEDNIIPTIKKFQRELAEMEEEIKNLKKS
jgi:hypothetical protein